MEVWRKVVTTMKSKQAQTMHIGDFEEPILEYHNIDSTANHVEE